MPTAKKIEGRVVEVKVVSGTTVQVRFVSSRPIYFEPGQFLSLFIPKGPRNSKLVKRCYTFANSPEDARKNGYELCVKLVPGGVGSFFLAMTRADHTFEAFAPYGDFRFFPSSPERNVVFISTGTGIAPFRSMATSARFLENPPAQALLIQGARHESGILYPGALEKVGVKTVYAISKPGDQWKGFRGRVTDYLRTLPKHWMWHTTDFYLCGNGDMIREVTSILRDGHGVPTSSIHRESFSPMAQRPSTAELSATAAASAANLHRFFGLRLPFRWFKPEY